MAYGIVVERAMVPLNRRVERFSGRRRAAAIEVGRGVATYRKFDQVTPTVLPTPGP